MRRVIRSIIQVFLFLYLSYPYIYFTGAEEIPRETEVSPNIGQRWAFCVGIGDYDDPEIIDLPKTRNDAKGLAGVIKKQGGFDHVIVFTDDLDRDNPQFPSKKEIQSTLNRCAKDIKPRDLILFSFFGHGITDPMGRAFLLTADTKLNLIADTGLPLNYVIDFIKKTGVDKSVIFIDAAREKVKKLGNGPSSGVFPDRYLSGDVTAQFYSTRKGLHSYDQEDADHGVFAQYLIRGFEGEADTGYMGNDDGAVTLREIAAYVREGVDRWSLESTKTQRPYIKILGEVLGETAISSVMKIEIREEAEVVAAPKSEEMEEGETESISEIARIEESKAFDEAKAAADIEEGGDIATEIEDKGALKDEGLEKKEDVIKKEVEVGAPAPTVEELLERKEVEDMQKEGIEEEIEKEIFDEAKAAADIEEGGDIATEIEDKGALKDEGLEKKEDVIEKAEKALASIPPETKPGRLSLRKDAKDLSSEDVKSMLQKYNFYSTCWNYNGDFCNPDGDFENHFVTKNDATVTDEATGLMWQKGGSEAAMTWVEAREYARKLNKEGFAEYSDWRVPTVEELVSLMESIWENGDLFIDPVFDKGSRYCWSLDTSGADRAWKANFHLGFIVDFPMTSKNSVRLVRSIPSATLPSD